MHREVDRSAAAPMRPGVPELWASAQQFEVLPVYVDMPAGRMLVLARHEAGVRFGVVGECCDAACSVDRAPARQARLIHSLHPPPDLLLLLVSERRQEKSTVLLTV